MRSLVSQRFYSRDMTHPTATGSYPLQEHLMRPFHLCLHLQGCSMKEYSHDDANFSCIRRRSCFRLLYFHDHISVNISLDIKRVATSFIVCNIKSHYGQMWEQSSDYFWRGKCKTWREVQQCIKCKSMM